MKIKYIVKSYHRKPDYYGNCYHAFRIVRCEDGFECWGRIDADNIKHFARFIPDGLYKTWSDSQANITDIWLEKREFDLMVESWEYADTKTEKDFVAWVGERFE